MAFSISEIRSRLQYGGARQTLFKILVTPPPALQEISGGLSVMEFLARSASQPSSQLGTITVPYFGRAYKISGDRVFDTWTTTIYNDEDFAIKHALETWNYKMNSYEGNKYVDIQAPLDYKSQAEVLQYSKTGEVLRTYKFSGIYPAIVGRIDMDWADTDRIEEFQVQWDYDYFTVEGDGTTGQLNKAAIAEPDV